MAKLSDYMNPIPETDTLDSVTDRGATTTNAVTVGNLTSTGIDDNATSTAITIDSSQNVGIGTASPDTILNVSSADDVISAKFKATNGVLRILPFETGLGVKIAATNGNESAFETLAYQGEDHQFITNTTEAMRIDSSGNVGIGTSISYNKLHTIGNLGLYAGDSTNGAQLYLGHSLFNNSNYYNSAPGIGAVGPYGGVAGGLAFYHYGGSQNSRNEAMRIDNSGKLLVGATSFTSYGTLNSYSNTGAPAGRFVAGSSMPDGSVALMVDKYSTTNSTSQWFVGFTINNTGTASGVITANGASQAAFGTWSDRRLKENVVDLPPQLENICALRPVEFDYIESEGGGHQISFIAQEFEEVYPDAVGERPDGMKTIAGWSKTEARLVKAIQEQQAKIEDLESRLSALETN